MNRGSRAQITGTLVAIVVTAAIVAGIVLMGSPAEERARRLDERRVRDLSGVARAIDLFWTRGSSLPSSLDVLGRETGADVSVTDPETNAPYEFRPLDKDRYELCAVFELDSRESDRGVDAGFWSHRPGRQCFERAAVAVR